jgi:hypothetical protein
LASSCAFGTSSGGGFLITFGLSLGFSGSTGSVGGSTDFSGFSLFVLGFDSSAFLASVNSVKLNARQFYSMKSFFTI